MDLLKIAEDTATAVLKDLEALIPGALEAAAGAGKTYLTDFKERTSTLLAVIADPTYKGDKLAYAIKCWNDEKELLKVEVLSFIIIGETIAQAAINSVQNILIAAVQSILPVA